MVALALVSFRGPLLEEAPSVCGAQAKSFEELCHGLILEVALELVQSNPPRPVVIHLES